MNGARVPIRQVGAQAYETRDGNFHLGRIDGLWHVGALTPDGTDALDATGHDGRGFKRLHQALQTCRSAQDWLKTDGSKDRLHRAFERARKVRAQREAETTTAGREPGQEGDRHATGHDDATARR